VDFSGTANLVALAKQRGLRKFVLITSIGTDDLINPLNLFWGVLFCECQETTGVAYRATTASEVASLSICRYQGVHTGPQHSGIYIY
jgi:hypothetical protein